MLTYSLSPDNDKPLYEQIYSFIRDDILNGALSPDEKLPSKRDFARNHGISVITVENAYGQLMAEGYIYSKPKSGFYVSQIQSQIPVPNSQSDLIAREGKENTKEALINLTSNHTDPSCFPFSVWAGLNRRILNDHPSELLTPPPMGGVVELRKAIARHLRDFRGIEVSYEQIIIGAGSEYLYNLIVQLLGQDKIYGLENPGSKKIRNIYQAQGIKVVPLTLDAEGVELTPDNLTLPDIIQISPSHHFPTGIVTSVSRRYGLLQWANEKDSRFIIEDDYDSEFRLQGKPIPSLFSMDTTDKVIYFNTFSKSLASTIRVSYMVLPKGLLDIYQKKLGFYSCTVSNFEQYILAAFIKEHHFEKHINRMRNFYRNLRDHLIEEIQGSKIGDRISLKEEHAGLHFLLKIDTSLSDAELKSLAREQGISVSFLSEYVSRDFGSTKQDYEHTAIINYSGLNEDIVPEAVAKLESAWKDIF